MSDSDVLYQGIRMRHTSSAGALHATRKRTLPTSEQISASIMSSVSSRGIKAVLRHEFGPER